MNINLSNLIIGLLTTSIVFTSPVSAVVIHASKLISGIDIPGTRYDVYL